MAGSAITFTPGEVAIFYAARVPDLEQRRAAKWRGPCPIHHGKKDSFEVRPHTGRWHCYSRCGRGGDMLDLEAELNGGDFPTRKAEVFRLVGRPEPMNGHHPTSMNLNPAGRAPTKPTEPTSPAGKWHEIVRYPYVDRDGRPLFEVVRYLKPDGDKAFKQCRPDGRGGIVWNLEGIKRVPYHLPKMLNADTVYLPEGEKDVHTLEEWGLVASCNPGGAGSSHRYREWADFFRGRQIVILPDNDEPGRKHAAAVAAALLSVAASLRIVELPGLPEEGDVTDWRDAGETIERFRELTQAAAPIDAAALSELRARWGLPDKEPHPAASAEAVDEWPKPELIQSELPPVQAFSEDHLPDSFRPLVADVAAHAGPDGLPGGGDGALSCRRRQPTGCHPTEGERYRLAGCAEPLGRNHRATGHHEITCNCGGYTSPESDSDRVAAGARRGTEGLRAGQRGIRTSACSVERTIQGERKEWEGGA